MAEQATQTDAPTQSANGRAPIPEDASAPDTGEKWLGVVVIAAGLFLLFAGIDRVSGGKLTGALSGGEDAGG